jgi:hypothetical protein
LRLLGEVVRRLGAEGIAHALIGAGAMAVHGVSRSTADLDLLTLDDRVLLRRTWADLDAGGLVQRILRGDADDPLAGSVRLSDQDEVVDVVLGRYAWQREIVDGSPRLTLGELSVPVAPPAGLVLLKLHAGGPKDAWDIRSLLEVADDPEALVNEVERLLPRLPVDARHLWSRLRAKA